MKKVLFVSEISPEVKSGGSMAARRDLAFLKEKYDVIETSIYTKERTKIKKIINLFFSKCPILYSRSETKKIIKIMKNTDAEIVFFESSLMGFFAKKAKQFGLKTVTFFQNCEYILFNTARKKIWLNKVYKQEKLALENSDRILLLNERDLKDLQGTYGVVKKNYSFYPVSIEDKFNPSFNYTDEIYGLFIGSWFRPNENAVKYIIDNIADYINVKIKVIGYKFENFTYKDNKNVEIIGTVDDTAKYVQDASFVIFPIFDGSGMKVKTCESMMFGKSIIASSEALVGYITNGNINRCADKLDFINTINSGQFKKYNPSVRKIWEENYSYDCVKKILYNTIESV